MAYNYLVSIWFKDYKISDFKDSSVNIDEHLGIEFLEIGKDYFKSRMPVDSRTKQPLGLLHGGASCVLAESTASFAAFLTIDPTKKTVVGLSLTANHIRTATSGHVFACAKAIHIGKSTSVWDVEITNDTDELISKITFTAMHKELKKKNSI